MEAEIKEIIAKNLPAHVGEALQERLKMVDTLEKENKELKERNEVQKGDLETLQKRVSDIQWRTKRAEELDQREKELDQKDRELQVKTLEYKLEAEKEKTSFSKEVALGLVRNIEFRRSLFDSTSEPYTDNNGYQQYANKTQNSEETKKAE